MRPFLFIAPNYLNVGNLNPPEDLVNWSEFPTDVSSFKWDGTKGEIQFHQTGEEAIPNQKVDDWNSFEKGDIWKKAVEDAMQTLQQPKPTEEDKMEFVRIVRDSLLRNADILVIRLMEAGKEIPTNLKEYRQLMRDAPTQLGKALPQVLVVETKREDGFIDYHIKWDAPLLPEVAI